MKNIDKMKALEICMNRVATVIMCPVVNGTVSQEYLGITDCCQNVITELIKNDFHMSLNKGVMIVDKF